MAINLDTLAEEMQFSFIADKDPYSTVLLTYSFAEWSQPADLPTSGSYTGWTPFTEAEQDEVRLMLEHIETFLDVHFMEIPSGTVEPDLNFGKVDMPFYIAGEGGPSISYIGTEILYWDGFAVFNNMLDLASGQRGLILHEIGHALGLKHSFTSPAVPDEYENNKFTLMSYTVNPDTGVDADAMQVFDIYALQDIWGANTTHNYFEDTYTGKRTATTDVIWDAGGTDVLDASADPDGAILDLRQGEYSTFGAYQDVAIAYGTVIENAIGSDFADTITGNDGDNAIWGNDKNDYIDALDGDDVVWGGRNNDQILGRNGDDTLYGDKGADRLQGQNGNDVLYGAQGRDRLYGANDDDKLFGGGGQDLLLGGNGRDSLTGGWGDDILEGGSSRDTLIGGQGDDILHGQGGRDRLVGGTQADTFIFALGDNHDTIVDFEDDIDLIQFIGLGSEAEILNLAEQVGSDVRWEFGLNDRLVVLDTTIADVWDDIAIVTV